MPAKLPPITRALVDMRSLFTNDEVDPDGAAAAHGRVHPIITWL
jgi:hypothetical protein